MANKRLQATTHKLSLCTPFRSLLDYLVQPVGRRLNRDVQQKREFAMKTNALTLLAIIVLMMSGCADTTPIKKLALPPVSTIDGTITKLGENGFTLTDKSGSIFVLARLPDHKKLDLSVDEKVKVYGNLQGGQERIFDGYVIRKSTGEQIIVSNPTPHFGFIIQSSFK
jgi:hypothetical protein